MKAHHAECEDIVGRRKRKACGLAETVRAGPGGLGVSSAGAQTPFLSCSLCILISCDRERQTDGICPVLATGTLPRSLAPGETRKSPRREA